MTVRRIDAPPGRTTPAGGAWASVFYCDLRGLPASPDEATQAIVTEFDSIGRRIEENWLDLGEGGAADLEARLLEPPEPNAGPG
jgi:hypothetical protein